MTLRTLGRVLLARIRGPSSLREEARITDTGLLRELLERIRKGVLAVGKGRQQWLKLQRLSQSSKRGPTNHFLRIGRSGNSGDTSGGAGSSSRLSNLRRDFHILSRLLSATDEPSRDFTEEEEEVSDMMDDAPYGWLVHLDDDENGAEEYERFNTQRRCLSPHSARGSLPTRGEVSSSGSAGDFTPETTS